MDDTEIERSISDGLEDVIDGIISGDSSFYGDDEHKTELEERSDNFNAAEAWSTRGPSLADRALANVAKERARDTATLYNPLQGQHCGRQLEESLDDFLNRLPPRTSVVSAELPWIWATNPYISRHDSEEREDSTVFRRRERFRDLCEELLERFEERITKWKIELAEKPAQVLTRAINNKRSDTVDLIHSHAIELGIKAGKWMLFIPSANVDHVWRIITWGTMAGNLGISAKVAPHDKDQDPEGRRARLICIYTKDFSDVEDVARVLGGLKKLGMVEGNYKIYYKPDAYTYLDIKKDNRYGIRPWIYSSSEVVIL